MKVGQEPVDDLKVKRGVDEDVCFPGTWNDLATISSSDCFENADRGCADSNDPTSFGASGIHGACGLFGHEKCFGVHDMVLDLFGFDRSKCAEADMQCNKMNLNCPDAESLEEIFGEVQARSGRGDRAAAFCVNRLIAESIGG